MLHRLLVRSVLLLTASALPGQFFTAVETEARRLARATWLGQSGQQSLTIDYGQPKWRANYESFVQQDSAMPLLLGKGALTTLRTDVDLTFGAQILPRGRWYLGARRDERQQWSLALFAADRVDASKQASTTMLSTEPDLRIPVRLTRVPESVELFEVTLTDSKQTPRSLSLAMAFGPFRLATEIAPAFDDRKPEGLPEFARTAAGKGTRTSSGLVYEVLHAGAGARPSANDLLRVHYTGWLADGTMIDATQVHGAPQPLSAKWVAKGLAEGLQLMQPGATFRFTIPPELGYGTQGLGSRVPANATLVYTVTLLGIEAK